MALFSFLFLEVENINLVNRYIILNRLPSQGCDEYNLNIISNRIVTTRNKILTRVLHQISLKISISIKKNVLKRIQP